MNISTSLLTFCRFILMDISTALTQIKTLSIDEHIRLVEAIWDSIAADRHEPLDLTETQRQELTSRLANHAANPRDVISWEEVKAQAKDRSRQ